MSKLSGVSRCPQSHREMCAGMPRAAPRPAVHLESWPPGINVYRHVWTMYVQCLDNLNASVQRLTDMVYTIIEKHKHAHHDSTCMYIFVNVCTCMYMVRTWYVQVVVWTCTYIVQTCMYMFIHLCTRFQSFKRVGTMYKPGCQGFVYLMLNVQTRKATYIL